METMTYKFIISYNGSAFDGWQAQTNTSNTVQEVLLNELRKMTNDYELSLYAASRTDKGVNATGQVIRVSTKKEIDSSNFIKGFNLKFKNKINISEIEKVSESFNPQLNIDYKEYHYYFSTTKLHPSLQGYIEESLNIQNIDSLITACSMINGEHNFKYFTTSETKENTARFIKSCNIKKVKLINSEVYCFQIQANGFLKYMIRFLIGALFDLGEGKITLDQFKDQLNGINRFTNRKANPNGLDLFLISYV